MIRGGQTAKVEGDVIGAARARVQASLAQSISDDLHVTEVLLNRREVLARRDD
jgi:hypothetical protein